MLLEGDIVGSFYMFPATIPFLATVFLLIGHLIFKFKHGARAIVWVFSSTVTVVVINYSVKIATGAIYH